MPFGPEPVTASDRMTDGIMTLTYQQRNYYELAAGRRALDGKLRQSAI